MTPRPSGACTPCLSGCLPRSRGSARSSRSREMQPSTLPGDDRIVLPRQEQFHDLEAFYSTMLHEMAHSTGSAGRLDRHLGEPSTGGLRPRGVGRRVLGGPGRPRPGRVERHSGRERSLPEGLAEGAARETGLYLLGIERRAAGRSLLRRRAVHEAFRHGSGREWGIGARPLLSRAFFRRRHSPAP